MRLPKTPVDPVGLGWQCAVRIDPVQRVEGLAGKANEERGS